MSILAKALLIVIMRQDQGNATVASESVTVVSSMEECRSAMRLFQSSKGEQTNVINRDNIVKFKKVNRWVSDTSYVLECKSFEEL